MLRSAMLTFRMHRFEVLLSAGLMALTAISAIVVQGHVIAANPPDECWAQNWRFDDQGILTPASRECRRLVEAFWPVAYEASFVTSPIAVAIPFVVGLLLGIPIVGRELELRTATLAWSLTGSRVRWLLARLLPMLALALVGLVVVAWLVAEMARAAHPWNYLGPGRIPNLTELGSEGPTLVGRGIMALGIGLLAGAVAGRTLPALAGAAILCFALLFVGAPALQNVIVDRVAVWVEGSPELGGLPTLRSLRFGFRDSDGGFLSEEEVYGEDIDPRCVGCTYEEYERWINENLVRVEFAAPIESYPVFEAAETALTSGIGLACMVATVPIVVRRRPS
ncbi:MAG: hypothetical protein H0V04_08160 [Chloroflexi bacterium]|nr:hypothetical protein [Chloroflexota bacterium]